MLTASNWSIDGEWGLGYGMVAFVDCMNGAGEMQQAEYHRLHGVWQRDWGIMGSTGPGMARRFSVALEERCLLIETCRCIFFVRFPRPV